MKLTPGSVCYANGNTYEIDGRLSPTEVTARDCGSGHLAILAIKDLREPPAITGTTDAALTDPLAWQRATRLAKALTPWAGHQRMETKAMAELARRHGLSLRQLQRLRARFEADPRTSALLPRVAGRPFGTHVLDDCQETIIAHAIKRHYACREQPSIAYLAERIGVLCRRLALAAPTRQTVTRRVREAECYDLDKARRGVKSAKQHWEPRIGGLDAQRPLQIVQIDHTRVDVLVVSEDRQRVIGRPWITLAIDVHTRCVVGWYLTMDAPSTVSVALCIEHVVLPKPENEVDPGVWPMFGKPELILVDNGKDFRAHALKTGCEQHGIELRWRPVKKPHYGAHIERLNGTLMRMVHLLKGTTFSNTRQRDGYESEKRATMTFEELRDWLVQAITRRYHVKSHRALGVSPLLAWESAMTDVSGAPRRVAQVARPMQFKLDFLPQAFRRVRRTGVEFARSRYWHDDLTAMLRQKDDAELRFDPRDPRCVWVRAGRMGFVEARAIAGRALGDGRADQRMTQDERARMDAALDDGYARRDAIEAKAQKATRAARLGQKPPNKVQREPGPPIVIDAEVMRIEPAASPPLERLALPAPAQPPQAATPSDAVVTPSVRPDAPPPYAPTLNVDGSLADESASDPDAPLPPTSPQLRPTVPAMSFEIWSP
jgi:putative transposase